MKYSSTYHSAILILICGKRNMWTRIISNWNITPNIDSSDIKRWSVGSEISEHRSSVTETFHCPYITVISTVSHIDINSWSQRTFLSSVVRANYIELDYIVLHLQSALKLELMTHSSGMYVSDLPTVTVC